MKAIVLASPVPVLNSTERSVELTVQYSEDDSTVIETNVLVVKADNLTQQIILDRMIDELDRKIEANQTMPTQSAINNLAIGVSAIRPG